MKNDLIETFGDLLDLRDKPFVMVDKIIIEDIETFNKNEVLAYIVICKFADNSSRQAFPSLSTISKFMRTSKETARLAVKGLIEKGVLVYQQRMNPDNPNENTSNAYAIVDNKNWTKAKIQNSKVIKAREEKYSIRVEKSRITKINNKKVASTAHTSNSTESSKNDSKPLININITQNEENIQEEIKKDTHVNIKLLKSSGISYVPYKKEKEKISNMDTEKLKIAIETTIKKANSKTWNYLITTYENLNKQESIQVKTKFANFNETFEKYSPDEFNEIIDISQKEKFELNNKDENNKVVSDENLINQAINILQSKTILDVDYNNSYWKDIIDEKVQELKRFK